MYSNPVMNLLKYSFQASGKFLLEGRFLLSSSMFLGRLVLFNGEFRVMGNLAAHVTHFVITQKSAMPFRLGCAGVKMKTFCRRDGGSMFLITKQRCLASSTRGTATLC